jgi:SPP1 gp7 family putative phage head morphogenesis protein
MSEKPNNQPQKTPLIKGSKRDLKKVLNPGELKALATDLYDVLWGGGGTGDREIFLSETFSSLVNIILAKIQDEYDRNDGEEYQFQIFQHGNHLESPSKVFERINTLYRKALADQSNRVDNLEQQFVINQQKFPLNKLIYTIQKLEELSFVSFADGKSTLEHFEKFKLYKELLLWGFHLVVEETDQDGVSLVVEEKDVAFDGKYICGDLLTLIRKVAAYKPIYEREIKIRDAYGLCFNKKDLKTIQMKLRDQIHCGGENAESIDQVAVRIRSALTDYVNVTLEQARIIARTEMIGRANYGSYVRIKQSGFRKKEWLTAKDDEVRPLHREMHGKIINVGDPWVFSDGNTLRYPGDPEGPDHLVVCCRCIEVVPESEWAFLQDDEE